MAWRKVKFVKEAFAPLDDPESENPRSASTSMDGNVGWWGGLVRRRGNCEVTKCFFTLSLEPKYLAGNDGEDSKMLVLITVTCDG